MMMMIEQLVPCDSHIINLVYVNFLNGKQNLLVFTKQLYFHTIGFLF
jgi:hypothetical protein